MLKLILTLLSTCILTLCQKAIIFSSSIGYYNYRQTSNALIIYKKLKSYGFLDTDILLIIPQNSGCCQKNPIFGSVSFKDSIYDNLNVQVQIDIDYSQLDLDTIIDVFRLRFNGQRLRKGFFISQKKEKLFVYNTGHGGNTYFKIRERQAIIDQHFKNIFNDLIATNKFSEILLMSDSCSAITPYETVDAQNFTAFGSSSFDEKSQSHGYDIEMNSPKSDDFTFYFNQYLENNDPRHKNITLKQLYNYLSYEKLNVHTKVVGKGKKYIKNINDFIVKKRPVYKKAFRLQNII